MEFTRLQEYVQVVTTLLVDGFVLAFTALIIAIIVMYIVDVTQTSLPVIASYYKSIGEFSYDGILSTEIVKGTTIDYVKERESSINACESRVQQVSREWKINILRIPRVFAHITLGGILSKNVLLSLGSYIKNELFTKQNKIPKYVEITQYNPLLGHSTKIKIIKYTMTDYIPITRAILSWLDLDNNSSQVIYSR